MTNYKQTAHTATGASASPLDAGAGLTFGSFSLRVVSLAADSQVALETSPDNTAWTQQCLVRGDGWGTARTDHRQRYSRTNVVSLGTGAAPLSAIVVCGP